MIFDKVPPPGAAGDAPRLQFRPLLGSRRWFSRCSRRPPPPA